MNKLLFLISWCTLLSSVSAFSQISSRTDYEIIMDNIKDDYVSTDNVSSLDASVASNLQSLQSNGSWSDIDYTSTSITAWQPHIHLTRVLNFARAYITPTSSHYQSNSLFFAIENALNFWDVTDPSSDNWWWNQIACPKSLGQILILLRYGYSKIPSTLETNLVNQMKRGDLTQPWFTGANKLDIAIHYIYRGILVQDAAVLSTGVNAAFEPVMLTDAAEGLQYDYSFRQHGPQQAIFTYGEIFAISTMEVAYNLRGTSYMLSESKKDILSKYIIETVQNIIRGKYIDFSTRGRGVSRENASTPTWLLSKLDKFKQVDPDNSTIYQNMADRMSGVQPPDYQVDSRHVQYWRSDFATHNRAGYSFSVRTSSTRVKKTEHVNNENLKGLYLGDGGNCIMVDGNEYNNIFPVWDWSKVPGTTIPEVTSFPLPTDLLGVYGKSKFTGGVSDGLYGAKVYAQNEYGTPAQKGWFFFDDEVICLGAGINSNAAQAIASTINQSHLDGNVVVSQNNTPTNVAKGSSYAYDESLQWVMHDNIGYFFPSGGNVKLSTQSQSGSWSSITDDSGASPDILNMDVFKLWMDHGVSPQESTYAYIVVPNKTTVSEMQAYNLNNIEITQNTSEIQAVKHKALDILQIIFYEAGTYDDGIIKVQVDKPCVMQLKNVSTSAVTVHIADVTQLYASTKAHFDVPGLTGTRELNFTLPSGAYAGSSTMLALDTNTPMATGPLTTSIIVNVPCIADSYVRNGSTYKDVNYGSDATIVVRKGELGYTREAFLKFDLSNIEGTIVSAKLAMDVQWAGSGVTLTNWDVKSVSDDSWTENGITWSNTPSKGQTLDTQPGVNGSVKWDVTSYAVSELSGDGIISLNVSSSISGQGTDAGFRSKENSSEALRPRLILEVEPKTSTVFQALPVEADAYVRDGSTYGDTNYGGSTELVVKNSGAGYNREAFLKFDLSNVNGTIVSAKLSMNVQWGAVDVALNSWDVKSVSDDSWTESGITWNNAPAKSATVLDGRPGQGSGAMIEWDVTDQAITELAGDKVISLNISSSVKGQYTDAGFRSKENTSSTLRPQLILEVKPISETIFSTADSFVRDGSTYGDTNYGTDVTMVVKNSGAGYNREAFLKFDLASINGTIASAKLVLNALWGGNDVVLNSWDVKSVSDDSWTESGITWNNAPAKSNSTLDSQPGKATGTLEWDVTEQAIAESAGDNIISFNVSSSIKGQSTDVGFASKENATASLRPKLVIEYDSNSNNNDNKLVLLSAKEDAISLPHNKFEVVSWPNPSEDYFNIRLAPDNTDRKVEIQVFDFAGREVYYRKGEAQQEYNFGSTFESGLYIVKVSQGNNHMEMKLIKR